MKGMALADLHVGQCVRIEAQPEMLRVHLSSGVCGNIIARLVANLQHHIDGALSMQDPDLNALLKLEPVPHSFEVSIVAAKGL